MNARKNTLVRLSLRGALAAVGVGLACCGLFAGEPASKAPSLRAAGLVALAGRLAKPAETLPAPADLGAERVAAFEEGRLFAFVRGVGPAGQCRAVFCRPDTLLIEQSFRKPAPWRLTGSVRALEAGAFAASAGGRSLAGRIVVPGGAAVRLAGGAITTAAAAGRYLAVFRVGSAAAAAAPEARAASTPEGLGVTVSTSAGKFTVTFPADADEPGTLAVASADGKQLLPRRHFPAGVMPHGPKGLAMLERWDRAYRGGRRPGWDVGRPASELRKAVEAGVLKPGPAVVLGCGTGTNAVYLAGKGFDVTAMDIAPTAISIAEEKARKAGVKVRWLVADVLNPPPLGTFDAIFDRGCYHGVRRVSAKGFVRTVNALSKPGTLMLLLAGNANQERHFGPPRVDEPELVGDFAATWDFVSLRESRFDSREGPARSSAWNWVALLRRRAEAKQK